MQELISQIESPFVVIENRNNAMEIMQAAEVRIGYGEFKEMDTSVLMNLTHAIYQEETLVDFLKKLL